MIEQLFSFLSEAMNSGFVLAIAASFGWGILSILLSPCHLSSIPVIIGYISSRENGSYRTAFNYSFMFSLGILITIAAIGIITMSLGRLLGDIGIWTNYFIAALFIVIGFNFLGVFDFSWNRINLNPTKDHGIRGALILGLIFGIGLGPCTFAFLAPVLGIVFHLASTSLFKAGLMILSFAVGHCLVIIAAGVLARFVQKYLNWSEDSKMAIYFKRCLGALLIFAGSYFIYTTF